MEQLSSLWSLSHTKKKPNGQIQANISHPNSEIVEDRDPYRPNHRVTADSVVEQDSLQAHICDLANSSKHISGVQPSAVSTNEEKTAKCWRFWNSRSNKQTAAHQGNHAAITSPSTFQGKLYTEEVVPVYSGLATRVADISDVEIAPNQINPSEVQDKQGHSTSDAEMNKVRIPESEAKEVQVQLKFCRLHLAAIRVQITQVQIETSELKARQVHQDVTVVLRIVEANTTAEEDLRLLQARQKLEFVLSQRDYTRWAKIEDFGFKNWTSTPESLAALAERIISRGHSFTKFLPPGDWHNTPFWDQICTSHHGEDEADLVNAKFGQKTHMVPISKLCAPHWVPSFVILFPHHGQYANLAARLFLFGWGSPMRSDGTQRRAIHSGFVHSNLNLVKVGNRQVVLDHPQMVMILTPSAGSETFEQWLERVLKDMGQESSFYLLALNEDIWIAMGFTCHRVSGRVKEVQGDDPSVQTAVDHFNTFIVKVCEHFKQYPLHIDESQIPRGTAGDKLRLCKIFRDFLASPDFSLSGFPVLDPTAIQTKQVICVDYSEASIRYPQEFEAVSPDNSNVSNPWAYPVLLRSLNSILTFIHRKFAWPQWEHFLSTVCSREGRMKLFNSREQSALLLLPGCQDFNDAHKHCLLCKAYAIVFGSTYEYFPDDIYHLAVDLIHGFRSLSDEELDLLVEFDEKELSNDNSESGDDNTTNLSSDNSKSPDDNVTNLSAGTRGKCLRS